MKQEQTPQAEIVLTRAQVREVDRACIEAFGIPGIVLMENASRALATEAIDLLRAANSRRALIVCGGGNNGGDGWAAARHLANAGVTPIILSTSEPRAGTDAQINAAITRRMNIEIITDTTKAGPFDLIIDALLGTGLMRPVEGEATQVIEWINAQHAPVLAADVPSGLDCDTGEPLGVAVRATATVTFVAMKPGFLIPSARPYVGRVIVGDIGAPRSLIEKLATASNRPKRN